MAKQRETFIPTAKKVIRRPKKVAATTIEAPTVPEDLQNAWGSVIAIATTHKLLQEGHYTYAHRNAVGVSIAFLEKLHGEALGNCARHPDAALIPEIQKLVDEKAKHVEANEN